MPQIENPSGNILSDTLNWVQINGEFYANGGEKYITIGNFKDDAHTAFIQNTNGTWIYSYYYIDDVSVIYCDVDAGLNETAIKDFTIAPNPASDKVEISFSNSNGLKTISVFSADGKLMKKITIISGDTKINIDVSDLSNGVYFLEVTSPSNTLRKKFIVLK